jgi:hypothetical protein
MKQRFEEPHAQVGQVGPTQTTINYKPTARSSKESRPEFTTHPEESAKQKVQQELFSIMMWQHEDITR